MNAKFASLTTWCAIDIPMYFSVMVIFKIYIQYFYLFTLFYSPCHMLVNKDYQKYLKTTRCHKAHQSGCFAEVHRKQVGRQRGV